jgi:hypothetical protein
VETKPEFRERQVPNGSLGTRERVKMVKKFLLIIIFSFGLLFFYQYKTDPKIGFWEVPKQQIDTENKASDGELFHLGPTSFVFDGKYIGMIFTSKRGKPNYHFLRVRSKFEKKKLFFLHPNNEWVPLATFDLLNRTPQRGK